MIAGRTGGGNDKIICLDFGLRVAYGLLGEGRRSDRDYYSARQSDRDF